MREGQEEALVCACVCAQCASAPPPQGQTPGHHVLGLRFLLWTPCHGGLMPSLVLSWSCAPALPDRGPHLAHLRSPESLASVSTWLCPIAEQSSLLRDAGGGPTTGGVPCCPQPRSHGRRLLAPAPVATGTTETGTWPPSNTDAGSWEGTRSRVIVLVLKERSSVLGQLACIRV